MFPRFTSRGKASYCSKLTCVTNSRCLFIFGTSQTSNAGNGFPMSSFSTKHLYSDKTCPYAAQQEASSDIGKFGWFQTSVNPRLNGYRPQHAMVSSYDFAPRKLATPSCNYAVHVHTSAVCQCTGSGQSSKTSTDEKLKGERSNESTEEDQDSKELQDLRRIVTVPNILTTMRLIVSPVIGYEVLQGHYSLAGSLFIFAGISDLLDGYIARKYPNQASALGSFIDPLADKFLASIMFLTLTMVDLIPLPLTLLVVSRDVALAAAAFYIRYISLAPPVSLSSYFDVTNHTATLQPLFISKVNTMIQLSLVAASLAAPVFNFVDHPLLHALCYLTAGTTAVSGISYIFAKDTYKIFKKHRQNKATQ